MNLTRREALRGGTASVAAIAASGAVGGAVPAVVDAKMSSLLPAADELLFGAIRAFYAVYEPAQRVSAASHVQWEETMTRARQRGLQPGTDEFFAFYDENRQDGLWESSNEAWERTGELVNGVFAIPATTLRGAIEKLKIVRLTVGANGDGSDADDDLDAFQEYEDPWFDKVLADLEHLAEEALS